MKSNYEDKIMIFLCLVGAIAFSIYLGRDMGVGGYLLGALIGFFGVIAVDVLIYKIVDFCKKIFRWIITGEKIKLIDDEEDKIKVSKLDSFLFLIAFICGLICSVYFGANIGFVGIFLGAGVGFIGIYSVARLVYQIISFYKKQIK